MPALLRQRQKLDYKRPHFFNAVSLLLILAAGVVVYVAYSLFPVWIVRSNVKNEMADALPMLWRYNLRPDEVAIPELAKIRARLTDAIRAAGVTDKKLTVTLVRGPKVVAVEAKFKFVAEFPGWGKKIEFDMAPREETDAARVDW